MRMFRTSQFVKMLVVSMQKEKELFSTLLLGHFWEEEKKKKKPGIEMALCVNWSDLPNMEIQIKFSNMEIHVHYAEWVMLTKSGQRPGMKSLIAGHRGG